MYIPLSYYSYFSSEQFVIIYKDEARERLDDPQATYALQGANSFPILGNIN